MLEKNDNYILLVEEKNSGFVWRIYFKENIVLSDEVTIYDSYMEAMSKGLYNYRIFITKKLEEY